MDIHVSRMLKSMMYLHIYIYIGSECGLGRWT
jgi:hypothetical protein